MIWFQILFTMAGLLLVFDSYSGEQLILKSGNISMTDEKNRGDESQWSQYEYFVIQWKDKILSADRDFLAMHNIKIHRYLPEDAYIVRASVEDLQKVRLQPGVRAIVPYRADWKVLIEGADFKGLAPDDLMDLQVVAFRGAEDIVNRKLRQVPGVRFVLLSAQYGRVMAVRSAVKPISEIEGIEWLQVSPEFETTYFDPGELEAKSFVAPEITGFESGTRVMKFDAAWNRGWDGSSQIVAAADTGVDTGVVGSLHDDLKNVVEGQVFGLFAKTWNDPMGHGTHVVGSVIGDGTASRGLIRGGAYGAKVVAQGMWSPMLDNLSVPSPLGKLFDKAYKSGARLHTNSWGSPQGLGAYDAFAVQVDEFMWEHPDMLIIFAAGNSGVDNDKSGRIDGNSVSNPGTAKNVLTVGASENYLLEGGIQRKLSELRGGHWMAEPIASDLLSNNIDGVAAFSSRGPTNDGRLKPEVVAPGTNIVSVRSRDPNAQLLWGEFDRDYLYSGGTSMATPLVAGGAAVVRQYLTEARKITDPSAALVKGVLMHSATDMFPGQFGSVGEAAGQELLTPRPNNDEGFGRVDLDMATNFVGSDMIVDEKTGLATNEVKEYTISVDKPGILEVTLVYTDAAGASASSKALVNDLSLEIVGSSGTLGVSQSLVNNHEHLHLNVEPGQYRARIKGVNVPSGRSGFQPFAIIATNR
jgi:subtilisin family serine protease